MRIELRLFFFRFGLIVSEPDLFAESLLGYTVFSKGLLGVVSSLFYGVVCSKWFQQQAL